MVDFHLFSAKKKLILDNYDIVFSCIMRYYIDEGNFAWRRRLRLPYAKPLPQGQQVMQGCAWKLSAQSSVCPTSRRTSLYVQGERIFLQYTSYIVKIYQKELLLPPESGDNSIP